MISLIYNQYRPSADRRNCRAEIWPRLDIIECSTFDFQISNSKIKFPRFRKYFKYDYCSIEFFCYGWLVPDNAFPKNHIRFHEAAADSGLSSFFLPSSHSCANAT